MRHVRTALAAFRGRAEDLPPVFDAACRDIVEDLGVSSGSVWFFDDDATAIECAALYDGRDARLLRGTRLREADSGAYFQALRRDSRVMADDAAAHPATSCLANYLLYRDVRSLLDHVVCTDGRAVAVLCCEQGGRARTWSEEDAAYLEQMAILLGVAFDLHRDMRKRTS
ncbi:GAF domain-containing protein [Niveispirillum sp. KHB5.9]|uniref:GAF domain-containing protein n=1 Tax=Niveispirillum sp. KHB5.9 TaxID=3400269 RepID=UPI003A8495D3